MVAQAAMQKARDSKEKVRRDKKSNNLISQMQFRLTALLATKRLVSQSSFGLLRPHNLPGAVVVIFHGFDFLAHMCDEHTDLFPGPTEKVGYVEDVAFDVLQRG